MVTIDYKVIVLSLKKVKDFSELFVADQLVFLFSIIIFQEILAKGDIFALMSIAKFLNLFVR